MNARLLLSLASILALALPSSASPTTPKGHLIIHGGGALTSDVIDRFIELGGGKNGHLVYVPTSLEDEPAAELQAAGFLNRVVPRGSVLAAAWVIVPLWVPSATASLTAVTVTVCGVLQLEMVKVRLGGETVNWLFGDGVMVTLAVGSPVSTTV